MHKPKWDGELTIGAVFQNYGEWRSEWWRSSGGSLMEGWKERHRQRHHY